MKGEVMSKSVVLIEGDGIGPEVAKATQRVLDACQLGLEWIPARAGVAALDAGDSSVLPETTLDAIREHGIALKGPCTTPIGSGFTSVNVGLRKSLDLYGAVRPVRSMPGVTTRYDNVDLVIVRENTEGLYAGIEHTVTDGVVTSLKVATRSACRRIAEFAFDYAEKRGRKKVSAFHKANIMKLSDGLFLEEAKKVAEEYPSIDYEEVIIDAGCMRMVKDPSQFDVVLCENLYGDIMSDLCAGLVGGLGVTPGANHGLVGSIFEAVHGSAPDIAGQDKANPLALLMSGVMLLRHLGDTRGYADCAEAADRVRDAYNACLEAGECTGDLGGSLTTTGFADAVIARLS